MLLIVLYTAPFFSFSINHFEGFQLFLYGLPSPYWGQDQVVTGLLTGQDLLEGLKNMELGFQ